MITITTLTEYQLILMNEEKRNELVEAKIQEANDQLTYFIKRLNEKINTYKADAPHDIKMLLAFNQLFEREFSQHKVFSLEGFEEITKTVRDKMLFLNNNFTFKESELVEDTTLYLVINPEIISDSIRDGTTDDTGSNKDKILKAVEKFQEYGIPFKLRLYFNTDSYDTYQILREDVRETIDIPFEEVSSFQVSKHRDTAEVVVTSIPPLSMDKLIDGFIYDTGLFLKRKKKIFFDFTPSTRPKHIVPQDFLLLVSRHIDNLLLDGDDNQVISRRATELWLDKSGKFKHTYEILDDFLNSPSIVSIKGLSRFYGFITSREIEVTGYSINEETFEEEEINVKFQNPDDLEFIYDDDLLVNLMKANPRSLVTDLVRIRGIIIRVTSFERTLKVVGKNLSSPQSKSDITLKENFSNLTFINKLYSKNYYDTFMKIFTDAKAFSLPNRFNVYLKRIAHKEGAVVETLDTRWFSNKSNINISSILEDLDGKVSRDLLLRNYILPKEGIVNKQVSVKTEDIRWISKQS